MIDGRKADAMARKFERQYSRGAQPFAPLSEKVATVIPDGWVIKKLPAKVAAGARKPKSGCIGGAATCGMIAQDTRAPLRAWAAKGINR